MLVNKVAGNFHVALGESVVRDGRFIHQFQPQDAPGFNTSHVVHHLSFGEPYPGMRKNPMDGLAKLCAEEVGTGLFQYFIKLVRVRGGNMCEGRECNCGSIPSAHAVHLSLGELGSTPVFCACRAHFLTPLRLPFTCRRLVVSCRLVVVVVRCCYLC